MGGIFIRVAVSIETANGRAGDFGALSLGLGIPFPGKTETDWQSGQWVAYRHYDCPLLRNGHSASFATLEEAQRAADAHASEGCPNSETIFDGFAFLPNADPWWSYPNRIALRTSVVCGVACRR
jgi:hypothetical protein